MDFWNFPIAPERASTFATEYDLLYFMLSALTAFFTVVVCGLVVFFAIRYRKGSRYSRKGAVESHLGMELTWSFIPLIMGLGMFFWSASLYSRMRRVPDNAMEIFVIGKQWMWHVQHPNGVRENNELHVPTGQPIKLVMISQDVIHSFFLPSFRVKQDVLPGRYTYQWFEATKPGRYHLWCAEYCGTQHSEMGGYVYVMKPEEYRRWLESGGEKKTAQKATMEQAGQQLYEQLSCANCHGGQDTERAPSLYRLYHKQVKLADGASVKADESYIRDAILSPYEKLTAGYAPTMPAYKGQLTEEQVLNLIAYVKTLGSQEPPAAPTQGAPARAESAGKRAASASGASKTPVGSTL